MPLFVCARAKVRRWREERLRSQTWDPSVSETTVMHVLTRHSLYSTQVLYKIKLWDKANNRSFFQAIDLRFVVQVASSNLVFQIC